MTGQERRTQAHLPSPSQAPHLRKATQDDSVGRDPVLHLMFNQSLDVLCGLLDASFILWGIWTQPHQVKPGQAEAVVVGKLSLAPSLS